MTTSGSYDVHQFAINMEMEIQRLNAQVDLFWPQELALYKQSGLENGMTLLDCGCGPGHLLEKIMGQFPDIHGFGIEVDESLVEVATRNASEKGLSHCSISNQSMLALNFPDNTFDFVISRLVLEHLPNPLPALQQVFRILKEGGKAVFVDNDFDLHLKTWPDCPTLDELYEAYRRARRADGGNPCLGRELPGLLKNAGFNEVDLQVVSAHSGILGDLAFLKAEGAGIPAQLVKNGYLKSDVLDRLAHEWHTMLNSENHAMMRVLFAATGVKKSPAILLDSALAQEAIPVSKDTSSSATAAVEQTGKVESLADLTAEIVEALASEMEVDPESIDATRSVIQLGGDSLAALGLCSVVEGRWSVNLSIAYVLSDASVEEIAKKVWEMICAK